MGFLSGVTSIFGQQGVQVVAAGLLSGVVGGTALVATGIVPVGGGPAVEAAKTTVLACPAKPPVLAEIGNGERVLVTGRSADGTWLQVYVAQPGIDRGWVEAKALQLQDAVESVPVADCARPTTPPSTGEPTAQATVALASPGRSIAPSPSVEPSPSAAPTLEPTHSPAPTKTPSPTKTPAPTPSKTPAPTKTPASTTPAPTVPPDNTKPVLSGLGANPTCVDVGGSPKSRISVQATDNVAVGSVSISISPPGGGGFVASMTPASGNTWTYEVFYNAGWGDGHINYTVTARDTANNLSDPANNDPFSPSNWLYHSASSCSIG